MYENVSPEYRAHVHRRYVTRKLNLYQFGSISSNPFHTFEHTVRMSFDPIYLRLIAEVSLAADDIIHPYTLSYSRFETLPENIHWTKTETAMSFATEKLLQCPHRDLQWFAYSEQQYRMV